MLNSRTDSAQIHSTVEPATPGGIVRNFTKGLMQVRSAMEPVAPPAIVRRQIRTPNFALLPKAVAPQNGLLVSTCLHTAMAAVLISVPILVPTRLMNVSDSAQDFDTQVEYQPLFLPTLPRLPETGPTAEPKIGSGLKPRNATDASDALPAAGPPSPNRPTPDYAGAQTIVSNPPHSTKGVQTILRPDLVTARKLNYPLRLPSLLMLPRPAFPSPAAPALEKPAPSKSKELSTVQANEPTVAVPLLPIDTPKLPVAVPEPVVPKTVDGSEPSVPVAAATTDPEVYGAKAVVVINAVSVPPAPVPAIPDAELAARFVLGPTENAAAGETASGGSGAGARASNVGENLLQRRENGTGTTVEAGGAAGAARPESRLGIGAVSGSSGGGTAATAARAPENNSFSGITISGGVPRRSGRTVATTAISSGSYALTVISSGNSGGASRDLGVFSRSETVYTVYIPMTDAGGGPDWPMQYALTNSAPAHNGSLNGLLTPPVVLKKIQATAPKTALTSNSGPVFVTGIVDENGKLQALRAIRALDARAQWAVNALAQWEFLAAQLDGKPVSSKILVGVSVRPAEEAGKQN
jgi:hypothetical protein